MLWITNKSISNKLQNTQAENQDVPDIFGEPDNGGINDKIENLLSGTKVKKNFGSDFLISGAKETFIYLQKLFTKGLILQHFDLEHHI